jgi:hypothetical protein
MVINGNNEYIIHKPHSSVSHYNKYAEIYYNEINKMDITDGFNAAHYFYYLFFTIKDIDQFIAKKYLHNIFKVENIVSNTENQGYNLYTSNWISHEDFILYSMIGGYQNPNMVIKYYPMLKNDINKYICLNWCYEHGLNLNEFQYIDLAYVAYNYGLFKDFIHYTTELVEKFPNSVIGNNNMKFIKEKLSNLNKYNVIIDCCNGITCLPSNFNLLSQYFNEIYLKLNDNINLSTINFPKNCVVYKINTEEDILNDKENLHFDANTQYDRITLKNDMQKLAYKIIK